MNNKVFIKQDGTIPGHRIIEELERRGGKFYGYATDKETFFINKEGVIVGTSFSFFSRFYINFFKYTELVYNKETDSFYEKTDCGFISFENMGTKEIYVATEGEYVIPDGYEVIIEDGKVIVRKKKWQPKEGDTVWFIKSSTDNCEYYVVSYRWESDIDIKIGINDFPTHYEAQDFCNKLNDAIKNVIEERRKEVEK